MSLTVLFIGGTGQISLPAVEQSVAAGHKVSVFNRGKTAADGMNDVESLVDDRKGKLDALRGRKWDVVIDDTGYIPKYVKMSADGKRFGRGTRGMNGRAWLPASVSWLGSWASGRSAPQSAYCPCNSPLMIHGVPNRSVNIPQLLAHIVGCCGMVTFPPSASVLKTRSASARVG